MFHRWNICLDFGFSAQSATQTGKLLYLFMPEQYIRKGSGYYQVTIEIALQTK